MMNINNMFPLPFGIDQLKINQKELDLILDYINNPKNLQKNHNNFTGSEYHILEKTPDLKKQIQIALKEFSDKTLGESEELEITQSWLNLTKPGSSHHRHSHRNSVLSGIFYIQTDINCGELHMIRPNENGITTQIKGQVINYNQYNFDYIYFIPTSNDLYIFPSRTFHEVKENKSNIDRISLSFNTFYRGSFGNLGDKTAVTFK